VAAQGKDPTTLGFERGSDKRSLQGERGRICVWRLSEHIYVSHVEGHLDREMAQLIIDLATPMYEAGVVSGFHDWLDMTGYDSASRIDLTNWVLKNRAKSRLFISMRSKLVAMGVSVANLALGNMIETFSNSEQLEAALARALRAQAAAASRSNPRR
jgi:hypothetical protein